MHWQASSLLSAPPAKPPKDAPVVVQSLCCVRLFATPWTAARQASLSFIISWSLLKLMSIESVMPPNHLLLCCLFSSCLQSFPASGSFPMNHLFASGGQSIGASSLASDLPVNIQDWSPLGLTVLISLQSKGLSRVFSRSEEHTVWTPVTNSQTQLSNWTPTKLTYFCKICKTICDHEHGAKAPFRVL